MKNKFLHCIARATVITVTTISAAVGQVYIDTFDAGPFTLTGSSDASAFVSATADPGEIAGGTREVGIIFESSPHSAASLQLGNGFLEYDRQQSGSFRANYGDFVAGTTMNLNLTLNGADRFYLNLLAAPGSFSIDLFVKDNSSLQRQRIASFNGNGPGLYELPFFNYGADMEFDKIGGMGLIISSGNPVGLYQFESLSVPEPQTYGIAVGISLLAFSIFIRRGQLRYRPQRVRKA
jgi:hypothetical protein